VEDLVSVIILNYNKYNFTLNCLESLLKQTYKNFEVILVDNGSKYQSFLELKKHIGEFEKKLNVILIRNNRNLYFAGGNNKAIKRAQGDFVCLLNYDTIVMPDFIEEMVKFLKKTPNAGMITPKIKIYKDKRILWNTGAYINFRSGIDWFNFIVFRIRSF